MFRVVRRFSRRRIDVVDRQGERESYALRRILTVDDLGQVQVGTTVVGRSQPACCGVNVVGVALNGISLHARGCGMFVVNLDKHSQSAIDKHRAHGGRIKFPMVLGIIKFCK